MIKKAFRVQLGMLNCVKLRELYVSEICTHPRSKPKIKGEWDVYWKTEEVLLIHNQYLCFSLICDLSYLVVRRYLLTKK